MDPLNHKIEKVSDFGTQEPWVARISFSLLNLVDHLPHSEHQKDKIKGWIFEISKELNSAYSDLLEVEKLETIKDVALYTKNSKYQNLYLALWRAYKDRFQKACKEIGYDIGFLFGDNTKFEPKSIEFIKNNPEIPDGFRKMLKGDRKIWQNGLSDFRNLYIEHKEIGEAVEKVFYRPDSARNIFDNVWQAIEDSIVILINAKLQEPLSIAEIPEKERDLACPERFKIGLTPKAYESLKNAK